MAKALKWVSPILAGPKAIAGAAIAFVGLVTGNVGMIATGVSMYAGAVNGKKPGAGSEIEQQQASVTSLSLGEFDREMIVGRAVTGGSYVDGTNYGGTHGTDWEALVIAVADHECDALEGFYVNDTYYAYAGDGAVAGFSNALEVYWRPGTETQTFPAGLVGYFGYDANSNGAGVAYVVVAYKYDQKVWPGGRPRFMFKVRGAKKYDPRKDSTVTGGSGAHRWATPSTWEWTENAAICRYAYTRGVYACGRVDQPEQLLVGRGLSAEEAPPERVFAHANLCDELVDGEPRYRVGGVIRASTAFIDVEEAFAAAMAGVIVQREGSVEIEPGQAKSPVVAITDGDLLRGEPVEFSEFRTDVQRVNSVNVRHVEPDQLWKDHSAGVLRDEADITLDGRVREETLGLALVTSRAQALRCGEIVRRLHRLERTASIVLGPRFSYIEDGDWLTWSSDRYTGGEAATWRVEGYSLGADWRIRLVLREISADAYADTAPPGDTSVPYTPVTPPTIISGPKGPMIVSRDPRYPVTTGETTITVAAFDAVLDRYPWALSLPAQNYTSLPNDTIYTLFWRLSTGAYSLVLAPASQTILADPDYIIIGSYRTALLGGGWTPPPDAPGGWETDHAVIS